MNGVISQTMMSILASSILHKSDNISVYQFSLNHGENNQRTVLEFNIGQQESPICDHCRKNPISTRNSSK